MPPRTQPKVVLLQGTLDMLILRTLLFGAAHGHGISSFIQQTTQDALIVEHGSLYPALHRLERNGWIASKWDTAPNRNREYKYYRLTPLGRKQLVAEQSKWEELVRAIDRVMQPITGE
jgi:PadR family transcriptional regulator, regulatory protein PadR